jgi:N-hydroxyarylamine O-acetyltransferase
MACGVGTRAIMVSVRGEWQSERLDLDEYLRRIGYDGGWDANLATLAGLHRCHVQTIPFENIDPLTGVRVDLDLGAIQDKLVGRRRGGYCFEQNLLFGAALERAGFTVTRLAARAWPGGATILPRTHMVLAVGFNEVGVGAKLCGVGFNTGRTWLCDVGFGGLGLLGPVALTDGADVRHDAWRYGVARSGDEWVLRARTATGWVDLYAFTEQPQHLVDYEVSNHYISTHPSSPFVHRLVAGRVTATRRLELTDRALTETTGDGQTERTVTDLGRLLRTDFGLDLDAATLAALNTRI